MKKKSLFAILILQLISLSLLAQTAVLPSGTGSSVNPYQISTLDNLYWLTQNRMG